MTFLHKLTRRLAANGPWAPDASRRARLLPSLAAVHRDVRRLTHRSSSVTACLAILTSLAAVGCSGEGGMSPEAEVALIHVWPRELELQSGRSVQMTAFGFVTESDSFPADVVWSAEGGSISAAGLFTAGSEPGTFHIAATHPQRLWLADTSTVSILPAPVSLVALRLEPRDPTVRLGDSLEVWVIGVTAEGDTQTVSEPILWTSEFGSVKAKGNGKGQYKPDRSGRGQVKASLDSLADSTVVTVLDTAVAQVSVTPANPVVTVGQTVQLGVELRDGAGNQLSGRAVVWSTADGGIATVSGSGLVTGQGVGTATITATSEGQAGTASVTVTTVPVASVTVSPTTLSLVVGQTGQLTATPRDAGGTPLTGRG
jgi:hypothetical protein